MPLYEYRCKQCGHQFEKIQSFSAPEEKECPVCRGELEKLISAPAFQFKGSGWYVNDYASKSGSKATATAAESSTDGKPAAAPSSQNKSGASSGASSESSSTPAAASSTTTSE
ncbi:MAG: zinc ribbon domain-containing protein [Silvibacterium sp.]